MDTTYTNKKLFFTIKVADLSEDTFVVTAFEGQEALSSPYELTIQLASKNPRIHAESVVDLPAVLTIWHNHVAQRHFHGITSRFVQSDTGKFHRFYQITLVPSLQRLTLRQNSRIFQHKTTVDIIDIILKEMRVFDVEFRIKRQLTLREFCVQYRESDLDFIQRIAAEEGLYYFFEHTENQHLLVFIDSRTSFVTLSSPFIYESNPGGSASQNYVDHFEAITQIRPAYAVLDDYSFKHPHAKFEQKYTGLNLSAQHEYYEHFDHPGGYKEVKLGREYARIRLEYLRSDAQISIGKSNIPTFFSGAKFTLTAHIFNHLNRAWLLTKVCHHGTQAQALEEMGGESQTDYRNQFHCIPDTIEWRAPPSLKPQIDGAQVATVVGPSSEEIYCDQYGRIKLQFHWDREGKSNQDSSCWIRVTQPWAGSGWGVMAIPRIGQEVVVEFLNGDPDQPIVIGRTYNAQNMPPQALPASKTKMAFRSQTHKGGGYNELAFEDDDGQQLLSMHAQKDMKIKVLNDKNTQVLGNHQEAVTKNQSVIIKENQQIEVLKNQTTSIKENYQNTVNKNHTSLVQGGHFLGIGVGSCEVPAGSSQTQAAQDIILSAGKDIVITNGKASIVLHANGNISIEGKLVDVKGETQINLNCDE